MSFISLSKLIAATTITHFTPLPLLPQFQSKKSHLPKPFKTYPHLLFRQHRTLTALCKPSDGESAETVTETEDEWVKKLPEKKKPLYSHSLPCVEAWLRQLGFCQTGDDPAAWVVEKRDWHANLNLDVTDLYIRYLKTGPGNLEKDVERRFSYALSREDIENAILGGP